MTFATLFYQVYLRVLKLADYYLLYLWLLAHQRYIRERLVSSRSITTFMRLFYVHSLCRISHTPSFSIHPPSPEFSAFSPPFELPCLRRVQLSYGRRPSTEASLLYAGLVLSFAYGLCDVSCLCNVLYSPHRSRSVR